MINYFTYDYPKPEGEHPFSIITEISSRPWNAANYLVHIGLQGKTLDYDEIKPCNLVFLIDSSGSMDSPHKLPLLKKAFRLLLNELNGMDRVAIVAHAGSAGLVLPSTPVLQKDRILSALENLHAGGSTAGGAGLRLAYRVAEENLLKEGNNRVILATDGDFNVGVSSPAELVRLIEEKRKADIYLTIWDSAIKGSGESRASRSADLRTISDLLLRQNLSPNLPQFCTSSKLDPEESLRGEAERGYPMASFSFRISLASCFTGFLCFLAIARSERKASSPTSISKCLLSIATSKSTGSRISS